MQKILFLIKKSNNHKYYLHFYTKKVGDINPEVALGVTMEQTNCVLCTE